MRYVVVAILMVWVVAGCGDDVVGTCSLTATCVEYEGDKAAARRSCDVAAGSFGDDTICPAADQKGGCRGTASNSEGTIEETWWFYQDKEAEIRAICESLGYQFVPAT